MPQIFQLKEQAGYYDGSSLANEDMCNVPIDTICLSLENAHISDDGIKHLTRCTQLKCIDLDGTKITDESLKTLSEMNTIEELWLEQTAITSTGLKYLNKLTNLRFISLDYCDISQEDIDIFYDENPNLE